MVARPKRLARLAVREYRQALASFSGNARLFLASLALGNLALGVLVTTFGIYVKSAGMSEAVVGDVEGAIALASAIVCLVAAPLVTVLGYRRIMLAAAALFALARIGQAAFPVSVALVVFGLLDGAGEGVMQGASAAFLSDNSTPAERPHLYSMDLIVRVGAAFVGGLAGGILPTLLRGAMGEVAALRVTVATAGVLLGASGIPLLGLRERLHPASHAFARYRDTVRAFSSWGHLARILAPHMIISVGAGMVIPFLSLYLKEHLGASLDQVGAVQGISQLAMGVAALAAPFIGRRLGLIRGTVLVEALSLPFLIAIPFVKWLPLAAVVFWARAALMNLSWPLFGQYSMEGVPPVSRPLVSGAMGFGWSVSWFTGSIIGGRLMLSSYTVPYAYAAVLYAVGIASAWILLKNRDVTPQRITAETGAPEVHH